MKRFVYIYTIRDIWLVYILVLFIFYNVYLDTHPTTIKGVLLSILVQYIYIVLVLVLTVVSYDNNHGNTNRDPMSENKRLNYLFVNYSLYYSKYLAIYH